MDYKEFLQATADKTLRLSFSSLVHLAKSPRHFAEYYTTPFNVTENILFGSLVHCLVLEPESFADRYRIAPQINKRTKAGKEQWQQFCEQSQGYDVIKEETYNQALLAIEGLKQCKPAMSLLTKAESVEQKIKFEYKGLTIKGVVDGMHKDFRFDLKTTQDASPKAFKWSVRKYMYHLQAAIYTHTCDDVPFYIIALQKDGNAAVYEISKQLMDHGRAVFEDLILKYKKCCFLDAWQQSFDFDAPDGVYLLD